MVVAFSFVLTLKCIDFLVLLAFLVLVARCVHYVEP